ncbi:MAG TPA: GMC family oxidoreductase N-terminal domain-containing protein [Candidatus Polarisedimenticolia bacterium]|nr:GMC family oxidoreductase N-terminal domain-containing protein [Candidatus Polarisedimenticolia bacterium]
MRRLSRPVDQMKNHYDIVVIGSGYGGGIAASRLARAGKSVCLLERGRELIPGEYPDTEPEVVRESQVDTKAGHLGSRTALLDFRVNEDINVVVGCGLGGTSLINANVSIVPETRVFADPCWPGALRDDVDTRLKEGYRLATEMLKPVAYPADQPPLAKLAALEKSAGQLGEKFYRPNINVTFKDGVNHVGVEQHHCNGCGDCCSGCNVGAKNTTLMNYLPDASNHGAEIFTEVGVRRLEHQGSAWHVHYQVLGSGREKFDAPTMFVAADVVVLAAGTLGSTEILLRSKAAGLPLSEKLGERFSGNGDVLGFTYNADTKVRGVGLGRRDADEVKPAGPCIAGIIDARQKPNLDDGMIIEEGVIPGAVGGMVGRAISSAAALFGKDTDSGAADELREKQRELESLVKGPYAGAVANTQTYLVMTHDGSSGKMQLEKDRLRIHWPKVGELPIFKRISNRLLEASKALGGTFVKNPLWSKLTHHNLTTVHPLGGCVMAEDAAAGVVNHKGQVYRGTMGTEVHDGLYVSDGSVVPRSLGVNPLLTISALAERTMALLAKDRGWVIDYTLPSSPASLDPQAKPRPGIRFTERMAGFVSKAEKGDFQKAADRGKQEGSTFEFVLTIVSADVDAMLADPGHLCRAVGTVKAPALSRDPMTVSEGTFRLFVKDPDHVETRQMVYDAPIATAEGKQYHMHGFKAIHNDKSGMDSWADTTTLFVTLTEGAGGNGAIVAKGMLHIDPKDFMVQMSTMEVTHVDDPRVKMEKTAAFGKFFAGVLFETYGGIAAKPNPFDGSPVPLRKKRPLRTGAPEVHYFKTADGVALRVKRYHGGNKGPVVMAPGFGTSTTAFDTDTIETNLPEFLHANGYDVFLFDYRASPELPSSGSLFTLDDVARKDWPAAIQTIQEISGADSVQMVNHCVGSMTGLMAVLAGMQGVRSMVCSQLGLFPVTAPANEIKAGLRMASFLTALGETQMDTNRPPDDWRSRLAKIIIQLYPPKELCQNSVCHHIRIIFGESYKHANLSQATHDALHEMFGVANLKSFEHILLMIRKDRVVDAKGKDTYLPNAARLKMPITFIQGADNGLFLPEGSLKTYRFLCEANGKEQYAHIMIPKFAHMDCFVGKEAVRDVFPTILLELEKHN